MKDNDKMHECSKTDCHNQEHEHCCENSCSSCGCDCSHSHETESVTKSEIIRIIISVVLLAASFFFSLVPLKLTLTLASAIIAGYDLFIEGFLNLIKLRFDELTLILIAVAAAFILGEYPEAVLVTILFKIGEMIEGFATANSNKNIESLIKLAPETVKVIGADGKSVEMPSKEVSIGTEILINKGDKFAIDSIITDGNTTIDSSAITGESLPVSVMQNDKVLSGAVNLGSAVRCKTTNTFDNSAATKIIEMVRSAADKKSGTENFISRFSKIYTPVVLILAVITAIVPIVFNLMPIKQAIMNALVFLVASCPCAIVISVPMGFFSAIGGSSKIGVLFKGGKYIEALAKISDIVFDKTGTLTNNNIVVSEVKTISDLSEDAVLKISASLEKYSSHPVSKAVLTKAKDLELYNISDCKEFAGLGIFGKIGNDEVFCGSQKLLCDNGIVFDDSNNANIYLSVNGIVKGMIYLTDEPKPDAKETISSLSSLGIKAHMLTGDNKAAAKKVADLCGISDFNASLLPEDKVTMLDKIKQDAGGKTAFVGDGINDAPVLASADVGIAIGVGSDIAIESADVVLIKDSLSLLPRAVKLARKSISIIKFNIIFAILFKAVVLVLGALGKAPMWLAVIADVGVTIITVLNAGRILKQKI